MGLNISSNTDLVSISWEGFLDHRSGVGIRDNPYANSPLKSAVWAKGWNDAASCKPRPEDAIEAYFIIDDALDEKRGEGFLVYFGCPHQAIGVKHGEYRQLAEAKRSIPAGEAVYRVKLARRHGKHSVIELVAPASADNRAKK